ncbi:UDP-N-acetylmuramoyl-L-alanyl-D-glutamate--2,6-diaminopimelate ligase [Arsenicicoccus dermatophilus]|uniref:UDP-N-acetylmuramoyl-L-alanyl-D-glutamate--2, 6-diaminopimelate ligase n=1 Tax=Arsenicicoccus dermatophilus TaxID=1076331 RepID=UPI0039171BDF
MVTFPRPESVLPVPLSDLVADLEGASLVVVAASGESPQARDRSVAGVTLDSRQVRAGDLYAALPGANVHGARFVAQAVAAGAVAVLTDRVGLELVRQGDGPPVEGLPVVVVPDPRAALGRAAARVYRPAVGSDPAPGVFGITGTNGKTTTAYLVDGGLRALGCRTGLIGTVETRIGDERIKSARTTPEASDLQALLAVMAERGVQRCTMEVSSHALVMHRVDGLVYDVAAFTNLSQDHLDFHGSMEDYFLAKASLFTPERCREGVVVVDDAWGVRLAAEATVPVVTVAARLPDADWLVRDLGDQRFELVGQGRTLRLRSPLPGDFNQLNTAVAALVLHLGGIDLEDAARAVCADPRVPGRMERVDAGGDDPMAVVDFAHTPDAVEAALAALRSQTAGRLVAVLGAGGSRDAGKRPLMGAAAAAGADLVVVTDDNPRDEDPAAIRRAVASGVGERDRDRVQVVAGRAAAIAAAVALTTGPQDTVVVLGKGHEQGQEVAGEVHPFDDRDELRRALARRHTTNDERAGAPQVDGQTERGEDRP